jgi:hypothetical protein
LGHITSYPEGNFKFFTNFRQENLFKLIRSRIQLQAFLFLIFKDCYYWTSVYSFADRDSFDGIASTASRYGLDGPGFKPRWKQEIFSSPYPSRLALGPYQPPLQWVYEIFSRDKAPEV